MWRCWDCWERKTVLKCISLMTIIGVKIIHVYTYMHFFFFWGGGYYKYGNYRFATKKINENSRLFRCPFTSNLIYLYISSLLTNDIDTDEPN